MAQVKLLKIDTDGLPVEFTSSSDEITLASYTVQGGGPVLGATGLDLNGQAAIDAASFQVTDPSVGYLNQTAGNLIFNNIMGKERSNVMTTAADILFPVVTDTAGQLDALRLPAIAGAPTATPTAGGEGFIVFDSTNDDLYIWDGSSWNNTSIVPSTQNIDDSYIAEVNVAARDVVYISSADNVSPADASASASSQAVGFAKAAALATAAVSVRKFGRMDGFTGLTAGSRYYLDASTPGAITSSVPSGSGNTIIQVGYAKNTTTLDIMIESLGRRS